MAIGDKKPVVMEADRAVAGGVATLGADGKLLDAQIPGLDKLGAAPALESTAYPGCYYRMVDGVVEWINPPLSTIGQEYRTTERYNGKPVYVKLLEVNPLPNNTVKYVNFCPIAELDSVVEVRGFIPDTLGHYKPVSTYPPAFTYSKQLAFEYSSGENYGVVAVYTNYDGTGTIGQALVKYTKTTN